MTSVPLTQTPKKHEDESFVRNNLLHSNDSMCTLNYFFCRVFVPMAFVKIVNFIRCTNNTTCDTILHNDTEIAVLYHITIENNWSCICMRKLWLITRLPHLCAICFTTSRWIKLFQKSLCNVMSHVVICAYPMKLNISTGNRVTKNLQKKLYCDFKCVSTDNDT